MDANNNTRYSLIEKIQENYCESSWEDFAEIYQNYIYAIIRRLGARDCDVDDLLQLVLLDIWKGIATFKRRNNSRFRTWLSIVTRHAVYRYYRKKDPVVSENNLINQPGAVNSDVEALVEKEWGKFIAAKAMETVAKQFSESKIQLFIDSSRGVKDDQLANENGIALSSVRVYRAQVQKALQREAIRLNRELD